MGLIHGVKMIYDLSKILERYGVDMKVYTVYRVDSRINKIKLVGKVVERRMGERHNNTADMLKLARKVYGKSSIDSNIVISSGDFPPWQFFGDA